MNATLNLRLFSGKRSLITTDQSKLSVRCSADTAVVHRKTPSRIRLVSLIAESPADRFPSLHPAYADIESQADEADHQHARHDEVITLSGVAGIDNEVAEAGVHGDHLRRDDHK